jgi:MFS family permease
MFSLINDLTTQINYSYFLNLDFPPNYRVVELVLAGLAAILFGVIADQKGRKRLALIGFVLLGLAYASLGLLPNNIVSGWFYVIADGIAWGALSMLFLWTIWGDIAEGKNSEKFYILGVLPYLFSTFAQQSLGVYFANNYTERTVFSFASFFLFVAVLPLVYAPETLSDRIIKDLDINSYVNKALEKVKKNNLKREKIS